MIKYIVMFKKIIVLSWVFMLSISCTNSNSNSIELSSPNDNLKLLFNVDQNGRMFYQLHKNEDLLIYNSHLGIEIK
mgnify:CR=1 FL=1